MIRQSIRSNLLVETHNPNDICFILYGEHRQTRPLEVVLWYSRWLTCESRLTYSYLLESVLLQFKHLYGIPKDPTFVACAIILYIDIYAIFANYNEHLVPKDVRSILPLHPWSMVYGYIQ